MNPVDLTGRTMDFCWFMGVVENRLDPAKMGRVQVRCFGYHDADLGILPTDKLLWAQVLQPGTSGVLAGLGRSPTGIVEGTWVCGFFLDGPDAQEPVIWGIFPGLASSERDTKQGFGDTRGDLTGFPKRVKGMSKDGYTVEVSDEELIFPPSDAVGLPDTHPLARGEQSNFKDLLRDVNVPTANGTFSEPKDPFEATYPFNHVYATESGHLQEFDDTPGHERINLWHRSGSFEEYHPNGDRVVKTVGSLYDLTYGASHEFAKGGKTLTADTLEIKVGSAVITIDGSGKVTISSPSEVDVGGLSGPFLTLVNSLFMALYNAHTHSSGASGPPDVLMTPTQLTTVLKGN